MQSRKLGNTDLELTTIGLGSWAIGGSWLFGWGGQDDSDSMETIFEAMDNGINWIDTAAIYGHGHSEEIVGKAVKQMSQKPIIATKCGLTWSRTDERIACLKKDSVIAECEASLKRLGVEVIDLYQMHWNHPAEDIEEGFEAMAKCVKAGKVRYIGVSNHTVEQLKLDSTIHSVASLQPPYSMLHREVEDELLDYCCENNIGVVAYSPMQRGLLTGKFSSERMARLADDDHRKANPDFQEPSLSATFELVEELKPIAQRNNGTLAQLAVAWVLRRKEVTSAIVGARRAGQITETVAAADWQLSSEDIEQIEKLLEKRTQKLKA